MKVLHYKFTVTEEFFLSVPACYNTFTSLHACTLKHILRENLTLAPGVHPPAKLASQMLLAAKTAAPASARLLSSVIHTNKHIDKSRH